MVGSFLSPILHHLHEEYKEASCGREATLLYFDFSGADYGWYIEMYIGLLLLSPFVNLAWTAAGSKKMRVAKDF